MYLHFPVKDKPPLPDMGQSNNNTLSATSASFSTRQLVARVPGDWFISWWLSCRHSDSLSDLYMNNLLGQNSTIQYNQWLTVYEIIKRKNKAGFRVKFVSSTHLLLFSTCIQKWKEWWSNLLTQKAITVKLICYKFVRHNVGTVASQQVGPRLSSGASWRGIDMYSLCRGTVGPL